MTPGPLPEVLGPVTVPSGTLRVLDCGLLAALLDGDSPDVPSVDIEGLPRNARLDVEGVRVADDEFPELWDWIAVVVDPSARVATSEHVGDVVVDCARIMFADRDALDAWDEGPLDGKADFVFWGRDAKLLAAATSAPDLGDREFGWTDLPVQECADLGVMAEEAKQQNGWLLATDFRPHSHHYRLLEQMRASPTGSGTIELGGATVCGAFTEWGDGVFPVLCDRDAAGALVRVRLQMRSPDWDAGRPS